MRGEGCPSYLQIKKFCEFHKEIFPKRNRTSKAMVLPIVVDLGNCPPSDKGIGCKNGTHAVPVICSFSPNINLTALAVGPGGGRESRNNQGATDRNSCSRHGFPLSIS